MSSPDTRPGVYLAGPDGFTAAGRLYHRDVVLPAVRAAGFRPLDPWGSAAHTAAPHTAAPDTAAPAPGGSADPQRFAAMARSNDALGRRNVELIDSADGLVANLDGADVDSGTAAEIGYAAARGIPVVAFRTDERDTGENAAAAVNLQVEYFIRASRGSVHTSVEGALAELDGLLAPAWAEGVR